MDDSNNLLERLYYIRNLLQAMGKQNEIQQQLESQIRQPSNLKQNIPEAQYHGKKIALITFIVLAAIFLLLYTPRIYFNEKEQLQYKIENDEFSWNIAHEFSEPYPGYDGPTQVSFLSCLLKVAIFAIPAAAVIALILGGILSIWNKSQNKHIRKQNQIINDWNQKTIVQNQEVEKQKQILLDEIQKICDKKQLISQEYQKNVLAWFPRDYGYPSAVEYFINKVENHVANTIGEAVQQYETDRYRQQKLNEIKNINKTIKEGQDELIRQQMIGNMINLANNARLGQIANASERAAFSAAQTADAANRMANRIGRY